MFTELCQEEHQPRKLTSFSEQLFQYGLFYPAILAIGFTTLGGMAFGLKFEMEERAVQKLLPALSMAVDENNDGKTSEREWLRTYRYFESRVNYPLYSYNHGRDLPPKLIRKYIDSHPRNNGLIIR